MSSKKRNLLSTPVHYSGDDHNRKSKSHSRSTTDLQHDMRENSTESVHLPHVSTSNDPSSLLKPISDTNSSSSNFEGKKHRNKLFSSKHHHHHHHPQQHLPPSNVNQETGPLRSLGNINQENGPVQPLMPICISRGRSKKHTKRPQSLGLELVDVFQQDKKLPLSPPPPNEKCNNESMTKINSGNFK
ncbi:unnamed protein product [Didymodactylos carnosus]|uniref:Uncharacterized protein n=1 Tax=Didymodactylos carnosus TaxID=1234261 RepID=A0A814JXN2_9BILA|nr:unnamed protein product [Didymodactylos carnosus]CAF3814586.1 unnamed protein product [Didymodactylos carnosus]